MNSINELYTRLLEGFPVKELKSYFGVSGTKIEIVKYIVANHDHEHINKFICDCFGYIHQHVNIYEVNKKIPVSTKDVLSGKCILYESNSVNATWIYLIKTKVLFYSTHTTQEEELHFLLPVKIENKGKKLIVRFNTFARDINTYFDYTVYPKRIGSIEYFIFDDFKNYISQVIFKLDLNKGVKKLWETDYFDGLIVKNKNSKSIRQERMDEDFTFKKQYPKEWKSLMKTPIQKTRFAILKKKLSIKHFECNPSTGSLGFNVHPEFEGDISKLISLILKNNA